jgi:hypothetical protein
MQLAAKKAEAVWKCLNVLCPDLRGEAKMDMARQILSLTDGINRSRPKPRVEIGRLQVHDIVVRNLQCISRKCPLLVFSQPIADEINEFLGADGG